FAFLGEGAPVGERSCYFAVDSTLKNRDKNGVAGAELEGHFEKVASQKFLALIDVHFLGFDAGKGPMPDFSVNSLGRDLLGSDEKGQQPVVIEAHNDDFVIGHNPTAFAKAQAQVKAFKTLAAEKELPREISDEGERFLSQMPKLDALRSLRKAYQQLADNKIDV